MKYIVDAHLPYQLKDWLINNGEDAIHTRDLLKKNLTNDRYIIDLSMKEERVIISKSLGQREVSVSLPDKLAKFYGITIDDIVHMGNEVPADIVLEDKTTSEQIRLISEPDEKDKSIIFSIIETLLTKKKFKNFV